MTTEETNLPPTGVLVILDGFGINPDPTYNAIAQAAAPTLRRLWVEYPHTELKASEKDVGLPSGFMGNSEVGHLNIGAGRVVYQDFSLISKDIEEGTFYENPVLLDLFKSVRETAHSTLHVMGLVSDGGVHSHISHLFAFLRAAKKKGVAKVKVHVFTDGRDTAPTSGVSFVEKLETYLRDGDLGEIATVSGRFYAMDRDRRWERVEQAYRGIAEGKEPKFTNAVEYIKESYRHEISDEFIRPASSKHYHGIEDGDGVFFFNFRADRARELVSALTEKEFSHFSRSRGPLLSRFVSMTSYSEEFSIPFAYTKAKVAHTLGEVVSRQGWKQVRVAETEKYAHVTYFFNGGVEVPFDGEKRCLIPSPREVKTYDLKPEMSAFAVVDTLLQELETEAYTLAVVNFANPDMVGHTGNLRAAVQAVEAVDKCLEKIVAWVETNNAFAAVTADHGNCEMMIDGAGAPMTAHTLLPVPFFWVDPQDKERKLRPGKLCDIAPTFLEKWGIDKPKEMTGKSLL